jgi:[ribosomal protein S5]-alanine N-acetyltransferase
MSYFFKKNIASMETDRLHLRRARPGDEISLFEEYCGNDASSKFLQRGIHASVDQTRRMLEKWCNNKWDDDSPEFAWVISHRKVDLAIGMLLVAFQERTCEIHFGIGHRFWKRGLMTEAMKSVIYFLESIKCFDKIVAFCDVENFGAQGVLAKLGFKQDGLMKNRITLPAFGNKARDCIHFTLFLI